MTTLGFIPCRHRLIAALGNDLAVVVGRGGARVAHAEGGEDEGVAPPVLLLEFTVPGPTFREGRGERGERGEWRDEGRGRGDTCVRACCLSIHPIT